MSVEKQSQLQVRPDGSLLLAVVADTHSNPHPELAEQLAALAPDAILHGGDIGDLRVLEDLARLAPLIAVRGNIDARAQELPDVVQLELKQGERTLYRLLLTHIALYGTKLRAEVARSARKHGAGLVVCGHSHIPFIGQDRGIHVFNPGSVGPRRFQLPIVFGVFELGAQGIRLRHMSCETGQQWVPPEFPRTPRPKQSLL